MLLKIEVKYTNNEIYDYVSEPGSALWELLYCLDNASSVDQIKIEGKGIIGLGCTNIKKFVEKFTWSN